jgi:putative phosphotransacetylase
LRAAPVPIGVSARHVHLCAEHLIALFGPGHELAPRNPLSQPGQFAAEETLVVAGPRGALEHVRVLGPVRGKSQVELAATDCYAIGIPAAVRDSGDIAGSPGVVLVGPAGSVALNEGAIVAARHLHMTTLDARHLGIANGDFVAVIAGAGRRAAMLDSVVCRVSDLYRLELHLDTDEANGAGCRSGDMAWIVDPAAIAGAGIAGVAAETARAGAEVGAPVSLPAPPATCEPVDLTARTVITEEDVMAAALSQPQRAIVASAGAIVTPLARDAIRRFGVELMTE